VDAPRFDFDSFFTVAISRTPQQGAPVKTPGKIKIPGRLVLITYSGKKSLNTEKKWHYGICLCVFIK